LITLGDGTRYEFESMRGYDFNYALFAELLQPSGAPFIAQIAT
jgi:hypothetical protein